MRKSEFGERFFLLKCKNKTALNPQFFCCRTPELQARKSGLEHLFQAIRNNNCSIFECKKQEIYNHRLLRN